MADRPINNDDLITIIRPQGGNKPEYRTIEELNNKYSTEEQSELTTLQAQVGNYDSTSKGSTITADIASGVNGTAGVSGAIRYEASKLWISVGESTAAESNWKYAELT